MKRTVFAMACVAPFGAFLWACIGDDDVFRPTDAGAFDGTPTSPPGPVIETDGGAGATTLACGDAGGAPPRVLLVQGSPGGSELAVVNLATKAVDGRLAFDGGYGGTSSPSTDPYLLGGESDVVTRLDAREPWKAVASWNVRGDDVPPGGDSNANPVAIAQVSCSKAYVLRFNRNRIAILDPSRPGVGVPTGYIDLSDLKEPSDPNTLEVTSAVYVAAKKRVYVLLGNADLTQVVKIGSFTKLRCVPSLHPSIVAIDVETDKVTSLGGTARGGGIALEGYNPPLGAPLVYDAAFDRLLVLQAGCNEPLDDGGAGETMRRRVEQVDLATGAVKTLLPLDTNAFPSTLAFVAGDQAALAFYYEGFFWDPKQPTLGPPIAGGIDLVAPDGRGAFVGTRAVYLEDGGAGPLEVLHVPLQSAGAPPEVVLRDPFSRPGGYVATVEAWPPP
jgi:hypothetical protein